MMGEEAQAEYRLTGSRLRFEGSLVRQAVPSLLEQVSQECTRVDRTTLIIDLSGVDRIDSAGVAFLSELMMLCRQAGLECDLAEVPVSIQNTLNTFSFRLSGEDQTAEIKETGTLLENMGERLYQVYLNLQDFFTVVSDTFFYAARGLLNGEGRRRGEVLKQSILIGTDALPIVGLISFLIGFILALQSAAQLRQFGASIYVADLIVISMTREMGPIMTAIALAGRSGSAIASEIANMVVTEETDALKTMGLNPVRYVVVPKFYAITLTAPMLTILSMVIGIFGALVIAVTYLNLSISPFLNEVANALFLKDVLTGLLKSFIFAWIIVLVGAYYGFDVKGGAEGVGRVTTASVVTSIFLVILADSIIGLIFYFGQGVEG